MSDELTQDLLRELFDYHDGELYWNIPRRGMRIGDRAGKVRKDWYRLIGINGKLYYAHRLIFLYHYGYLPKFLDHIDGDGLNNNINNLREATNQENAMNMKKPKSHNGKPTSSKYKGVDLDKRRNKWRSRIMIDGKSKHLGYYKSEIEAARDYNKAATEVFGKFVKLNEIPISRSVGDMRRNRE